MAVLVPDAVRGRSAAWFQAGNLGSLPLLGGVALWLIEKTTLVTAATGIALIAFLPSLAVLFIEEPRRAPRPSSSDLWGNVPRDQDNPAEAADLARPAGLPIPAGRGRRLQPLFGDRCRLPRLARHRALGHRAPGRRPRHGRGSLSRRRTQRPTAAAHDLRRLRNGDGTLGGSDDGCANLAGDVLDRRPCLPGQLRNELGRLLRLCPRAQRLGAPDCRHAHGALHLGERRRRIVYDLAGRSWRPGLGCSGLARHRRRPRPGDCGPAARAVQTPPGTVGVHARSGGGFAPPLAG